MAGASPSMISVAAGRLLAPPRYVYSAGPAWGGRKPLQSLAYEEPVPVSSMTGFARGTGQDGPVAWTWEAKSVNGRGLDVRCRLPAGMDALDPEIRRIAGELFARGSLTVSLQIEGGHGETRLNVNRAALGQIIDVCNELRREVDAAPTSLEALFAIRGVVELAEEEEAPEARSRRDAMIVDDLRKTLDALDTARRTEGARIASVLVDRLDEIADLTERAADSAALQPETLRARLAERVGELIDETPALPEERLAQEVALLLVKSDGREEVDRMRAHVDAARELIEAGGAIGRRFDFLCQEFSREANTLCSKATDVALTRIGLDLKVVVDQLREQVQNLE